MKHKIAPSLGLASALLASPLVAQITWTGATNNTWLDAGNWSGGDGIPNAAGEVARFNASVVNAAPSLGSATTIGKLEFLTGAGSYGLTGSALTISSTSGSVFVENSSGAAQTIGNALTLSTGANSGTRNILVGAASTLNLNGTVTGNGTSSNLFFDGTGTANLGANIASFGNVQQGASATLNVNFAVTAGTYVSTTNTGRINFNASTVRTFQTGNASSGAGRVFITTDGVSVFGGSFRGGNSVTNTIGADIAGGGTATVGTLNLSNAAQTNTLNILSSAAGNNLVFTGAFTTGGAAVAAGAGTRVQIQGPGTVTFSGTGANTANVPLTIDSGTLALNKTAGVDALSAFNHTTVNTGGTLRLLAADQINASANLVLNGGTFDANGFSEGLGTLDLNAASFLLLGSTGSNTVSFANSSALDWGSFTLSISGSFVSGQSVRFGTDATGLGAGQLSLITVNGQNVTLDANGYLAAIPEPSAFAALAGLGALGLAAVRRSRRPAARA